MSLPAALVPARRTVAQPREELLAAAAQASRLLLESSNVMATMPEVLQLFGEAAGVDRVTLATAEIGPAGERWLLIHSQWNAPGIAPSADCDASSTWQARREDCFCSELKAGRSVYLCGAGRSWSLDGGTDANGETKSSVIVPFLVEGEYAGAVGFDTFRDERQFDPAVISALEIAASIVGSALQRERLLETMRREREAAAEQRVGQLARANAALRANLEHLASQPAEFFGNVLLETTRQVGAAAGTAVVRGYEVDRWLVGAHVRDGHIEVAPFADSIPQQPDSAFMRQLSDLRQPLHLETRDNFLLASWPEFLDYHRREGHESLYLLPLVFGERNLGFVALGFRVHDPLGPDLVELLVALGQQVTLAMAMKRLAWSARQGAVLAERIRIGREIHDGLAQAFTGILMQLGASEELAEGSPFAPVHDRIREIAREGLAEARRSVLALRHEEPRVGGLELALRQLAERSTVAGRIASSFNGGAAATGLPPEHEHALLRIAQEAVINAVRHAEPRGIEIRLESDGEALVLTIRDDGRGMQEVAELHAQQGFGLNNMRERAEAIGGSWRIDSRPGAGTLVSVRVPRAMRPAAPGERACS